jgi:hypothetical protein
MSSFIASFSSERLAIMRFIRAFLSSIARPRAISLLSMPPYFAFQAEIVLRCAPCPRPSSTNEAGAVFFESRDDLRLRKAGLPHDAVPFGVSAGKPTVSRGPDYRGGVSTTCEYGRKVVAGLHPRTPHPTSGRAECVPSGVLLRILRHERRDGFRDDLVRSRDFQADPHVSLTMPLLKTSHTANEEDTPFRGAFFKGVGRR